MTRVKKLHSQYNLVAQTLKTEHMQYLAVGTPSSI
jgi:hypothetical protein